MSKKLYPRVYLPVGADIVARNFVRHIVRPKILNWRLPDQTQAVAEELLNTDGETLLNTDGETLFNTGA